MSKSNIIFLDFDGVLCNARSSLAVGESGVYSYLDPIACQLVKRLCDKCNAKIVISSTWRLLYDYYALQGILNASCSSLGNYIASPADKMQWRTEHLSGKPRGAEIKEWLETHAGLFSGFVIIDDDNDMEPFMERLVQTDTYNGIGFTDYIKAEEILCSSLSKPVNKGENL